MLRFLIHLIISCLLTFLPYISWFLNPVKSNFAQISWQDRFSVKFPARWGFSEKFPGSGATTANLFLPLWPNNWLFQCPEIWIFYSTTLYFTTISIFWAVAMPLINNNMALSPAGNGSKRSPLEGQSDRHCWGCILSIILWCCTF